MTRPPALLVLADGTAFIGESFGASTTVEGEVVFNTSMSGYPELLTDPSYRRQILTLTVPEVGNYGVCERDGESERIQAAGLVVRHLSEVVSNWRSTIDLSSWLAAHGVPGIVGVDTRDRATPA
jgi:carbamoyl-phosphate synthase small subunit